jgi:hypothetical protein
MVVGLKSEARMNDPFSRLAIRFAYGASQLPRVAWYVGHSLAVRRLSKAARRQDGKKGWPRAALCHKRKYDVLWHDL